MKKGKSKKLDVDRTSADEILPEYDFSCARPNKYAGRYPKGGIVVTLDPDVAAIFPGAGQVNAALRALADIIRTTQPRRAAPRRST
jgi:hypothetical protein